MGGASVTSEETSPSIAAIVAAGDPALAEHRTVTSPDGMMTIAFTDIEGSTAMLEQLREGQWLELIREHNRIVREVVSDYRGEVVKSQGDGFMVVFASASASAALTCAVELQRRLAQHNERNPGRQLRVRIGLHTGNVFAAEHDFLGKPWCWLRGSPAGLGAARSWFPAPAASTPTASAAGGTADPESYG
jgi:class 3 adenylate cyclase